MFAALLLSIFLHCCVCCSGPSSSVKLFARYKDDFIFRRFQSFDLDFDASEDFHEYRLHYYKCATLLHYLHSVLFS